MELEVADPGFRATLDAPAYRVRQHNGYVYWNVRLLRRDVEARYVGATHEYLALDGTPARLDAIAFADHASGSSRATKVERDIALLSAALEADPGDVRAMFYLAQTCRDAGRHDEARTWYRKRIDAGGWDEETWYALFMHARSSLALGDEVGFVDGCLDAYEFRPSRAEPLAALACYYRERGAERDRNAVGRGGRAHRVPRRTTSCSSTRASTAMRSCTRRASPATTAATPRVAGLRTRPCSSFSSAATFPRACATSPGGTGSTTRRCAEALLGRRRLVRLEPSLPATYTATNPSVFRDGDALAAIVRGVNYRLDDSLSRRAT